MKEFVTRLCTEYAQLPEVEAVAIAGSQTTMLSDSDSDLDVYVYLNSPIFLSQRKRISESFSRDPEVGNTFFEPGDEWIDESTGIAVDVMFRDIPWMEAQLERILELHQATVGYSTCFWHNIRSSRVLFDRSGRFAALQAKADQPYPQALRQAIINKNFPILRNTQSSFLHQLKCAADRQDLVSIHHRVTAILSSYFDVLFALNEIPHPGEKRLIAFAEIHCEKLPVDMKKQIHHLLLSPTQEKVERANDLIENLEGLLREP
jgi:hypothetical protein